MISIAFYLWWVPIALATVLLAGFSVTAEKAYAIVGLALLPLGGLCAVVGIALVLIELGRLKQYAMTRRRAIYRRGVGVMVLLLLNFPLAIAFAWSGMQLSIEPARDQTLSPDRTWVAETYLLSEHDDPADGDGVRLRPYWAWSRKYASVVVFKGECTNPSGPPTLRWVDRRTLVIRCPGPGRVSLRRERTRDITIYYE